MMHIFFINYLLFRTIFCENWIRLHLKNKMKVIPSTESTSTSEYNDEENDFSVDVENVVDDEIDCDSLLTNNYVLRDGTKYLDLRPYPIMTIDNELASVFDDAIHAVKHDNGIIEIGIHCVYFDIGVLNSTFRKAEFKLKGKGKKDGIFDQKFLTQHSLECGKESTVFSLFMFYDTKQNKVIKLLYSHSIIIVKAQLTFNEYDLLIHDKVPQSLRRFAMTSNRVIDECKLLLECTRTVLQGMQDKSGKPLVTNNGKDIIGYLGTYCNAYVGRLLDKYYGEYALTTFVIFLLT